MGSARWFGLQLVFLEEMGSEVCKQVCKMPRCRPTLLTFERRRQNYLQY